MNTTISIESATKRQKLETDLVDTIPDAPGIRWPTGYSDLYLIVPAEPSVTKDDTKVELVRFPVHRAYVCLFPLLEGILNHPGGSERRSIDMTKAGLDVLQDSATRSPETVGNVGWNAKHWLAVLKFAYDHPLADLPRPATLVNEWMSRVGWDPSLETTHLFMYLFALDLGCYMSDNLRRCNLEPGFALAFCLIHSATDVSSLTIFKDNFIDYQYTRLNTLNALANWLCGPGRPLQKDNKELSAAPTPQQVKICEWLFLTVATTKDDHIEFWQNFLVQMKEFESMIQQVNVDTFATNWFCYLTSLLVEFSPCAVHNKKLDWDDDATTQILYKLHPRNATHVCGYTTFPGVTNFVFRFGPLFSGLVLEWGWSKDQTGTRSTAGRFFEYSEHPIMETWRMRCRGNTTRPAPAPFPSHVIACVSYRLEKRQPEPTEQLDVQ